MSDTKQFKEGDQVGWNWGAGHAEGTVAEKYEEPVQKEFNGKTLTRKGDEENPAYYVERPGKTSVLKKGSGLHPPGSEALK